MVNRTTDHMDVYAVRVLISHGWARRDRKREVLAVCGCGQKDQMAMEPRLYVLLSGALHCHQTVQDRPKTAERCPRDQSKTAQRSPRVLRMFLQGPKKPREAPKRPPPGPLNQVLGRPKLLKDQRELFQWLLILMIST